MLIPEPRVQPLYDIIFPFSRAITIAALLLLLQTMLPFQYKLLSSTTAPIRTTIALKPSKLLQASKGTPFTKKHQRPLVQNNCIPYSGSTLYQNQKHSNRIACGAILRESVYFICCGASPSLLNFESAKESWRGCRVCNMDSYVRRILSPQSFKWGRLSDFVPRGSGAVKRNVPANGCSGVTSGRYHREVDECDS